MDLNKKDVIVYDGICVLCNFFMRWLLKNDIKDHFRYTTFESAFIIKNYPNINLLDSIIVITQDNKKLYKGRAVLYILKKINKLKPITYFLKIFPSKLIDFFYTIIAKTRYKIFGKYDSCPFVEKKYLKKILK